MNIKGGIMDSFEFYEYVKQLDRRFMNKEENVEQAIEYAYLISSKFKRENKEDLEIIESRLRDVYIKVKDDKIATYYANTLANSSYLQNSNEIKITLRKIRELYSRHIITSIAYCFVVVLSEVIKKQESDENEIHINKIRDLYFKHPSEDIANYYLSSLCNTILYNDTVRVRDTVNTAFNIYTNHPTQRNGILYSIVLKDLIIKYPNQKFSYETMHFKTLYKNYPSKEMAFNFMFFLAKEAQKSHGNKTEADYILAKQICETFPSFALESCFSYVCLSYICTLDVEDAIKELTTLENLHLKYKVEEIAINYILAINYIFKKNKDFNYETFSNIASVYSEFKSSKVAAIYSKVLRSTILKFVKKDLICKMQDIYSEFSDNYEVTYNYIIALSFYFKFTKDDEIEKYFNIIEKIYLEWENDDITNIYIKILGLYAIKDEKNFEYCLQKINNIVINTTSKYIENSTFTMLLKLIKSVETKNKIIILDYIFNLYENRQNIDVALQYLNAVKSMQNKEIEISSFKKIDYIFKHNKNYEIAVLYAQLIEQCSTYENTKFNKFAIKKINKLYKLHPSKQINECRKNVYANTNL